MQPLRRPFGSAGRGADLVWPGWTGPPSLARRGRRPAEMWELRPETETAAGERVLTDLHEDTDPDDALLIAARYLIVRLARHTDRPLAGFDAGTERAAARQYLEAMSGQSPDRRWLEAVIGASAGGSTRALVSRLTAAAGAADRRGHENGSFALRYAAWEIAVRNAWHSEAGRVARAIAASADRSGGRRSRSLWNRRARVHEARAAA